MAKKLLSEQQVKDALNIESFRNLSKEKVMEFVSLIPSMDKDIALSIINQFPVFSDLAQSMIAQLSETCDAAISQNASSQDSVFEAYRKILDDLGEILKRENITPEERDLISTRMIEVADKMAAKDSENKSFLSWIIKNKEYILSGVLVLGSVILGVVSKDND